VSSVAEFERVVCFKRQSSPVGSAEPAEWPSLATVAGEMRVGKAGRETRRSIGIGEGFLGTYDYARATSRRPVFFSDPGIFSEVFQPGMVKESARVVSAAAPSAAVRSS
jgi:hypothetical protein